MEVINLLSKLLEKRGIKSANDLDQDEKKDFDNWQAILSKEELTISDLKEFCDSQLGIIEGKWQDYDIKNTKKAELIPYHTVYKTLLAVIKSPQVAREQLEKQLTELLK